MLSLNRFARGLFVLAVGIYAGIHSTAGQKAAKDWEPAIIVALLLASALILLTTQWLRDRRPTVRAGRRDGVPGIWMEPPTKIVGAKRRLRRETMELVLDLHKTAPWPFRAWWSSHPEDVAAANDALREAQARGMDRDEAIDEVFTPTLNQLTERRRAETQADVARRLSEVSREYVKRGMLSQDEADGLSVVPKASKPGDGLVLLDSTDISPAERLERLAREL